MNFREFREQNPDMDRHAARAMFLDARGAARGAGRSASVSSFSHSQMTGLAENRLDNVRSANSASLNTQNLMRQMRGQTRQENDLGSTVRLRDGLDLDLTSSTRNIVLGKNLFAGRESIDIASGDGTKTVFAGSQVSAAEYIAVKQILSGDGQRLTLDKSGRASGGSVDLDSITSNNDTMRAANFVVSKDVTTTGDFSKRSDFKLLGDLNNFGTVLAVAGSQNARSGAIRADDINNFSGATISSELDLTLDAAGSLNNAGNIVSTQGLNLSAGTVVNNAGTISSINDLTVNSASTSNRGTIESKFGSVTLAAPAGAALVGDNNRGTIAAVAGVINLRDASYTGSEDSFITGGNLLSKTFAMNAGGGTAYADVNELSGSVEQTGNAAHVRARTETLTLGSVCLTGDPTFFNTAGDVLVDADLSFPEALVIAASGNVIIGNNVDVEARSATAGFDVTLIAGADFTNTGGSNRPVLNPGTVGGGAGSISLTGKASKTGGSVFVGDSASITTQATSSAVPSNGGSIFLYAFGGKGSETGPAGSVDASGATFNTSGQMTGQNGNVIIVAGAKKPLGGRSVFLPEISANAASTATGSLVVRTANIVSSEKGTPVVYNANGTRSGTAVLEGAEKVNKASGVFLLTGNDINLGGLARIEVGGDIQFDADLTADGQVIMGTFGNITNSSSEITAGTGLFLTADNIGGSSNSLIVSAPVIGFNVTGDFAKIFNDANTTLSQAIGKKAQVEFFSSGTLASSVAITGKTVELFADTLTLAEVNGTESVSLQAISITNASMPAVLNTTSLLLLADDIGSLANPVLIPASVKTLGAETGFGDLFISTQSTKTTEVVRFNSAARADIIAAGSLTINDFNGVNAGDTAAFEVSAGSLTFKDDVFAGEFIQIANLDEKGKIIFENGVILRTSGPAADAIILRLNGGNTNDPGPIPNLTVTGTANLRGTGAKAKKPNNEIIGNPGTFVDFQNNGKAGNLKFGGDVSIVADF